MSAASKKFRKVLKVAAIAAVVWFTAGTASAYMAAPSAGLGSAMSASASSMYGTVAGVFTAQGVPAAAMVPEGSAALATQATATNAAIASGTELAAGAGTAGLDIAATTASADLAAATAAGQTGIINGVVPQVASTGLSSNQVMGMMVGGQALSGAYGAYAGEKAQDKAIAADKEKRQSYGLGGFDWEGNSAFKEKPAGIVNAQQQQQAVNPTQVGGQSVTAQQGQAVDGQAPQNRMIKRKDLPQLQKQGLIASNQVA